MVAASLSRWNRVLSTEWTLHSEVANLCGRHGTALCSAFANCQDFRIPTFPVIKEFSTTASSSGLISHSDSSVLAMQGWFPVLIQATVDALKLLPSRRDLLWQPYFHRFHDGFRTLPLTAWKLLNNSCIVTDVHEEWLDF